MPRLPRRQYLWMAADLCRIERQHSRDLKAIRKELKGIRAELARIHSANPSPYLGLADFIPAMVAPAAAMMALRAMGGKSKGKKKSKTAPKG